MCTADGMQWFKLEHISIAEMLGFDSHDAILLTISSCGGTLNGRVTVQKLVYFHTINIKEFSPHYTHHYYGPFSRVVASALYDLSAFAFVNEIAHPRFHEGYAYEMTEEGSKYAEAASSEFPEENKQIDETVRTCKAFCELKPAPLSYAAKCHYIVAKQGGGEYTVDNVRSGGKDLNWRISDKDARTGIDLLKKLRLDK